MDKVIYITLAVVLILYCVDRFYLSPRRDRAIAQQGEKVMATVKDIEQRRSFPWGVFQHLIAEWNDPLSGKNYTFFSSDSKQSLSERYPAGSQVPVYIDSHDPNRYYVDIEREPGKFHLFQ